jgi:acyl-coenzyme A thioesterase PaaI-like protein
MSVWIQVFTAELKVTYLRPGTENEIFAKGWVIKPGKNLHFCEAEVRRSEMVY